MKIRSVEVADLESVIEWSNHNTEMFFRSMKNLDKRLLRLERKKCFSVLAGFIFGIVADLWFMEQRQRIEELEAKLWELDGKVKELSGAGEGD